MEKITIGLPSDVSAKLEKIAKDMNTSIEDIIKDILDHYTDEAYEDCLLAKVAKNRLKDIDKAVEVNLN